PQILHDGVADAYDDVARTRQQSKHSPRLRRHQCEVFMLGVDDTDTGKARRQPRIDQLGDMMSLDNVDRRRSKKTPQSHEQAIVEARLSASDQDGNRHSLEVRLQRPTTVDGADRGSEPRTVESGHD